MLKNSEINDTMKKIKTNLTQNQCENIGNEKWSRNCPKCNKKLFYSTKYSPIYAEIKKSLCNSCSSKGRSVWNSGKSMTLDFRNKCSQGLKQKYNQGWSPRVNKHHTIKTKEKISKSHIGKILSEEHKQKISNAMIGEKNHFYGKHHNEEYKKRKRILLIERMEKLGIPSNEDVGAKQFFEKYNLENKTEFIPTKFMDIGYFADGYDKNLHAWMEYDTPMHESISQKKKDLIRQNNIINHFSSIKNPLTSFTRVKVDSSRNVLKIIQYL